MTGSGVRIGLLPLYLALYDTASPEVRPRINGIYAQMADSLRDHGMDPVCVPICRVEEEFRTAVDTFEREEVCAVVTIHLAYSPSLQSIEALCRIRVPLIVLDTTVTADFGSGTEPDEIMYNHGIHGVQDMCNLLLRRGKKFFLEAGHFEQSDVLSRVGKLCMAASAAQRMRSARVGIVGQPFDGMGDFQIPFEELKDCIGMTVVPFPGERGGIIGNDQPEAILAQSRINAEMERDLRDFEPISYDRNIHDRTVRAGLRLRDWIAEEKLTAFTVNFLAITRNSGFECVPFLEAGRQMAEGIGYAGEGDVLTAALIGALASIHPQTTFTEMFCPDWQGNTLFLSHMGEMNLRIAAGRPRLMEMDFPYTDAKNPMVAYGRYMPGIAVLVNLAPSAGGRFTLILSRVEVLDVKSEDKMADSIHGWIRPALPIAAFLKEYSLAGGTHHLAMVYGDVLDDLVPFGEMMGFDVKVIGRTRP